MRGASGLLLVDAGGKPRIELSRPAPEGRNGRVRSSAHLAAAPAALRLGP